LSWKVIAFIASGSFFLVIAVILIVFLYVRLKKPKRVIKSGYYSLPSESQEFSVKDLAQDINIKQIDEKEIHLGKRIATGASGEVFKGKWNNEDIAVKKFDLKSNSESVTKNFLMEIKISNAFEHKNILKFLGTTITSNNEIYLVMEYMDNGSLKDVLDKNPTNFDFKLKLRMLIDASRGMEYLHSLNPPCFHRDLKPSNLLVDKKWRVKIADFGISKLQSSTTYKTTQIVGTPAYLAPEVISSNKFSDKSDTYSFGILIGEVITGETPYGDQNMFPQQIMFLVVSNNLRPTIPDNVPTNIAILIGELVDAEPKRRPTFSEVKNRLKRMQ